MALSLRTGIPYQFLEDLDGDVLDAYVAVIEDFDSKKG